MKLLRIKSITEFHRFRGVSNPEHPLISLIDYSKVKFPDEGPVNVVMEFYSIALKRDIGGKLYYGQQVYDFDQGLMSFIAPGQVLRIEIDPDASGNRSGYLLQIHPDFFWNSPLAKTIKQYAFFDYAINEALFLSEKEEGIITNIFENIRQEYHTNIDRFSQDLIIAQIELLLKYCDRFYNRQFLTRKISNHQMLSKVEDLLNDYFNDKNTAEKSLLSVRFVADALNVSPDYLSSLLKIHTGQNTQQHIHNKLIEKAKEKLSTTNLSVSEIAYQLGFEHPQSFSKLFKTKTNLSPLEFRASFN
ncbi:helix-turn-helix domain-containing protein [Flavobacterium defluvii]|uniref:Transcriptional regulator, AraC family n=1 Tax=Flavobacterium defluvii TaxID=370979 RepID=A0A1M5WMQ7_9FLAO|nr:helix-turn-helix transcriptional regulator [Flavobacterium defluvii]SHH88860.1 transcriptional regulator, AraC family [Flavobacterium defluvii]